MAVFLPIELQVFFIQNLSTAELYHLISGKTSAIAALCSISTNLSDADVPNSKSIIKEFYTLARRDFLERRGYVASKYQSAAIRYWLTQWETEKKLAFIQNDADKEEMLGHLNAALLDPLSTYDHKLRCCLLINQLYPNPQNNTPAILKYIDSNSAANFPGDPDFKVFVLPAPENTIEELISSIMPPMNHSQDAINLAAQIGTSFDIDKILDVLIPMVFAQNANTREYAIKSLQILNPTLTNNTQKNRVFEAIMLVLDDALFDVRDSAIEASGFLGSVLLSDDQKIKLHNNLINKLKDTNRFIVTKAAVALCKLAPTLASDTLIDELLEFLLKKSNYEDELYSILIPCSLTPFFSTDAQRNKLLDALISKFRAMATDDNYINNHIIDRLCYALAPSLGTDSLKKLIKSAIQYSDSYWYILSLSGFALNLLISSLTLEQINTMVDEYIARSNSSAIYLRQHATEKLGAFARYLSRDDQREQKNRVLDALSTKLQDADISIRAVAAKAVRALAPSLSRTELQKFAPINEMTCVQLVEQTLLYVSQIKHKNNYNALMQDFSQKVKTDSEPKISWRFWSKVGNSSQAVDNCFKELKANYKMRMD